MPQRIISRYCFTLLLLCGCFFSAAQEMITRQYTNRQGLPVDDVFCAAQDANGFMWFGTAFGIAYFDGRNFTHYYRNEGMINKAVTDIAAAGGDSLLFISYPDALQSISSKTGRIQTLVQNITAFKPSRIERYGSKFFIYQPGTDQYAIWTNKELHLLNINSILKTTGVTLNALVTIKEEQTYLACTTAGAFIVFGNGANSISVKENITCALVREGSNIVLAGEKNIYFTEPGRGTVMPAVKLPPGFKVNNMVEEPGGGILLGNRDKGLLELKNEQLSDVSQQHALQTGTIRRFFTDTDRNTWFCTNGGILLKKRNAFSSPAASRLPNNDIEQLLVSYGQVYIGTANGLLLLRSSEMPEAVPLPASPGKAQSVEILQHAANGKILAAVTGTETGNMPALKIRNNILLFNREFAATDGNGGYWVFDEGSKNMLRYSGNNPQPVDMFSFAFSGCRKVYAHILYKGQHWFGTDKGIVKIRNNRTEHIPSVLGKKLQQVFKFLVDKNNVLWLATDDGLLYYHDRSFNRFFIGEGYIANYCRDMALDGSGNKWIATWDGIVLITPTATRRMNIRDGLISKTVNCLAVDENAGKLYAGTSNGLSMLNMNEAPAQPVKKAFVHCFQRDSLKTPVLQNSSLPPGKYSFAFSISMPEYGFPEEITFDYRLDDGAWKQLKEYTINIDDIRSGRHRFYVRPHATGNMMNTPVTEFVFTIKTPFYKKWWFIALMIALAQGLIILAVSYINKRKRKQAVRRHQQLLELATLRQKAFTTLINPHFIFNALNSVQNYINRQDRQAANRYLADFASLIRKNFDAAQQAFIPLNKELESIKLYLQLEQMRFPGKFDYELSVAEDIDTEEIMIPSMIVQPFLENAILHGLSQRESEGLLWVQFDHLNGALHIEITDNGIGMEKSRASRSGSTHNSRGMQLIKEKLNVLSRFGGRPVSLEIKEAYPGSENPGVRITIIIPDSIYMNFPGEEAGI